MIVADRHKHEESTMTYQAILQDSFIGYSFEHGYPFWCYLLLEDNPLLNSSTF
jgi:hypothetical protein